MTNWRSTGHRGDALEELILLSNDYYKQQKLGRVDKVNVPIKVIRRNDQGMIEKAFFEQRSTVDFHGVIQGMPIVFDAKETSLKSIPIQNIHVHQIEYMRDIDYQGGLAFIIIHYKAYDEFYLIPYEMVWHYYMGSKNGKRKSIPYKAMLDIFQIKREGYGILNYLPILNNYVKWKETQNQF
ncbi:MAG TPA: Holliday junction resolvase RecU [Clostridia bacterium]|nr:Holliday junction resolvase RecU [Clostridia bacterium]